MRSKKWKYRIDIFELNCVAMETNRDQSELKFNEIIITSFKLSKSTMK